MLGVEARERCVAHTALTWYHGVQRGHTMPCMTAVGGLHKPPGQPSPSPLCGAAHLPAPPAPHAGLRDTSVGIIYGPQEVSAWEMRWIHFVVWPNNFLSCHFVEK